MCSLAAATRAAAYKASQHCVLTQQLSSHTVSNRKHLTMSQQQQDLKGMNAIVTGGGKVS